MNNEEKFKKSLNDLLDSKEFSFDEKEWGNARNLIDGSRKRRRMAVFFLSGLLLLITGGSGIYLYTSTTHPVEKHVSIVQPSSVINKKPAEDEQAGAVLNTEPVEPVSPGAPDPEQPAPASTVPRPSGKSPMRGDAGEQKQDKEIPAQRVEAGRMEVTVTKQPSVVSGNTADGGPETSPQPVSVFVPETAAPSGETVREPSGSTGDPAMLAASGKPVSSGDAKDTPPSDEAPTSDKNNPVQDNVPAVIRQQAKDTAPAEQVLEKQPGSVAGQTDQTIVTPVAGDKVTQPATDSSAIKPALSQKPDSAAAPVTPEPNVKLVSGLFVEAGGTYHSSWKNAGTKDADGFNPQVGIHYINYVAPKISMSFGLQYNSVGNLSFSSRTSKITRYRLGEESEVTVITPVKLHYLTVPVRFGYDLDARNMIGVGYNIAYLLNVDCQVETYTERMSGTEGQQAYRTENHQSYKTSGYTEGFKWYDSQVAVFYRRSVYKNIWLNAELYYGLTDIKDNTFFKSPVVERNTGIKLTVGYNLFNK